MSAQRAAAGVAPMCPARGGWAAAPACDSHGRAEHESGSHSREVWRVRERGLRVGAVHEVWEALGCGERARPAWSRTRDRSDYRLTRREALNNTRVESAGR